MITYVPGFQSFFRFFLHHFVLAKLADSSIRANSVHELGDDFVFCQVVVL